MESVFSGETHGLGSRQYQRMKQTTMIGSRPLVPEGSRFRIPYVMIKWLAPFLCNIFANMCMFVMLHMGTYYYIRVIDHFEEVYELRDLPSRYSSSLSPGLTKRSVSFGSLQDPLEGAMGFTPMDIHTIDAIASFLPVSWLILVVYLADLQVWTKTLVAHAMLSFFKGIFGIITIIPDSIGWKMCKARLGEANLELFRHQVATPESDGLVAFAKSIVQIEIGGFKSGKPVRFCGDMMYSGHTYVCCLYGLALVELGRRATINWSRPLHLVVVYSLNLLFIGEQVVEIYTVLQNRFHYSMDIVMAILLVLLWYTNAPLAIASKRWSTFGDGKTGPVPVESIPQEIKDSVLQGDRSFELIRFSERASSEMRHRANELGFVVVDTKEGINIDPRLMTRDPNFSLPDGLQDWVNSLGLRLLPAQAAHRRDGDLWVHTACVPFSCCCLWGQYHIVSDYNFKKYAPASSEGLLYAEHQQSMAPMERGSSRELARNNMSVV